MYNSYDEDEVSLTLHASNTNVVKSYKSCSGWTRLYL